MSNVGIKKVFELSYKFLFSILCFLRRSRNKKIKYGVALSIVLTIFVCFLTMGKIALTVDDAFLQTFLEASKCPACYGTDFCAVAIRMTNRPFERNTTTLTLNPVSRWNSLLNVKNVYYGTFREKNIVLKKLAHQSELRKYDEAIHEICAKMITTSKDEAMNCKLVCNFDNGVGNSLSEISHCLYDQSPESDANVILRKLLHLLKPQMEAKGMTSDTVFCESPRFFKLTLDDYINYTRKTNETVVSVVSNLVTSLVLNAEPVIMRLFSKSSLSERFPEYIGSCGRAIVVNYAGSTLDNLASFPWIQRLNISVDLLRFAQQMTSNSLNLNLYWTDMAFENFAVSPTSGYTVLVDVEGIIVVDPDSVGNGMGLEHNSGIHVNPFGELDDLRFSADDLCSHCVADHNIYAVCKCFLSASPCSPGMHGGLLWGTPQEVNEEWPQLSVLLKECEQGLHRFEAAQKLISTMEDILKWPFHKTI